MNEAKKELEEQFSVESSSSSTIYFELNLYKLKLNLHSSDWSLHYICKNFGFRVQTSEKFINFDLLSENMKVTLKKVESGQHRKSSLTSNNKTHLTTKSTSDAYRSEYDSTKSKYNSLPIIFYKYFIKSDILMVIDTIKFDSMALYLIVLLYRK